MAIMSMVENWKGSEEKMTRGVFCTASPGVFLPMCLLCCCCCVCVVVAVVVVVCVVVVRALS